MSRRGLRRVLTLGLPTILGLARRGFFIPCRLAGTADAAAGSGYPGLEARFESAAASFGSLLDGVDGHAETLLSMGEGRPPAPRWRQDWFPRLDAAAAYALIRARRPARLVEVGSGHSTRWFARAAADAGVSTRITAIDPAPRATLEGLDVDLLRTTVQQAGLTPFASLRAGDMLSLDGSHVLMPGTDTDVVLNRVLPTLPPGVLVHIHDIFLPDGYPPEWAWRGYNEQLAVAALLQGDGWRILWSSRWVATRMRERLGKSVAARLPLIPGAHESSLWLEKVGGSHP